MRLGSYGLPYRHPAGGWHTPPLTFLGGLYQHQRSTLNNVPALQNTTQVFLQPNQVGPPQTRYTPPGGPGCEQHPDNGLPNTAWVGLPPGDFVNTFTPQGTVSYGLNCRQRGFKNVQAVRQWHGTLGFVDRDFCYSQVCFATGHNRPGVTGGGFGTITAGVFNYAGPIGAQHQGAAPQTKYLEQVLTINFSGTFSGINASSAFSSDLVVNALSGQQSPGPAGCFSNPVPAGDQDFPFDPGNDFRAKLVTLLDYNSIVSYFAQFISLDGGAGVSATQYYTNPSAGVFRLCTDAVPIPGTSGYPAATLEEITVPVDGMGNLTTGTFQRKMYLPVSATLSYVNTYTETLTVSNTAITYVMEQSSVYGPYNGLTYIMTAQAVLSNPNPAAGVYADLATLLGQWNLADDGQYPPRTDGLWQVAPLVSRDEHAADVAPGYLWTSNVNDLRAPINDPHGNAPFSVGWTPTYAQMTWFDPEAWQFVWPPGQSVLTTAATALIQYAETGALLGAPGTTGQQNYFDFRATIWKACPYVNDYGTFIDWYAYGYGQWLTDEIALTGAQLPLTATQWTDNYSAMSKPPWAYLIQGDQQTYDQDGQPGPSTDFYASRPDALWAQKCVVYPELWPSYDFFEPAGKAKFVYDETQVCCVSGLSTPETGGTFTSVDNTGTPITLTPAAGSIWGGYAVGGFYDITVSGSTVTLGTKRYHCPSDWASRSGDTTTCFGCLRWTTDNATVPSLLGRAAVTTASTTFDFSTPQPSFGMSMAGTEQIDIYDASMTLLAGNVTATRVTDTTFTTAATYAAAAWVLIHGSPDWSWCDNGRKGDFVELDWTFDYRTAGEIVRLTGQTDCSGNPLPLPAARPTGPGYSAFNQVQYENTTGLPFKPCCPMAICLSPNGETFTNGITLPFPATFNFDDAYGARWQMEIEEVMVPSWWQPPHIPCGWTNTWTADNGTCQADTDTVKYYAAAPLVEARITVPTYGGAGANLTAPTPPTGIGYLSPVTNAGGLTPPGATSAGIAGYDPTTGNPNAYWTTWGYRMAIESTCGGSCRFNYVDMENLPCVSSYACSEPQSLPADIGTNSGNTNTNALT